MIQFFSSLFSISPTVAAVLGPVWQSIVEVWDYTWWFFLPAILIFVAWDMWITYAHLNWSRSIKWVILEIKVPKNVLKTPKAMEQIFAAAHTPYSYGLRWQDKYLKGAGELFMSFELVGRAGETHFYLRVPDRFRNMMESAIFAQYPEAEIVVVEDYAKEMPKILPNEEFDVGGYEVLFRKKDFYPLRTYPEFEESIEEHRIDTIAPLIEAMEKMQGEQQLWIQFIVAPTGEEFKEEGEKEIKKIFQIEEKKESHSWFPKLDLGITFAEVVRAPFIPPGPPSGHEEKQQPRPPRVVLTPTEKEVTEGISKKINKLAHKTTIRFLAIERTGENPHGVMSTLFLTLSYLRQFNQQNMQATRPDGESRTFGIYGLFKKYKQHYRKRVLYEHYLHRGQNHHAPTLNIEELATLYHFPITTVSSTGLEKIESKKGSPPATLPIIEEEDIASSL